MSDTQPHEVDHSENDSRSGATGLAWLGGILAIYLGVFVLLLLDEFVFRTNIFSQSFPNLIQPVRILYFPLLRIGNRLGFFSNLPSIF